MSAPAQPAVSVGPNTPITIKVLYDGNTRRFKIPLRDLNAQALPQKLHQLLDVSSGADVIFERFSDSAGCYVQLDSTNVAVYKQLYRAAKAKLKLRIKATTVNKRLPVSPVSQEPTGSLMDQQNYLDAVLSQPAPEVRNTAEPRAVSASAWDLPWDVSNDAKGTVDLPLRSSNPDTAPPQPEYREYTSSQDNLDLPFISHHSPSGMFCIDCNNCGQSIPNEHYHCSICDNGDYDLCLQCVNSGISCQDDDHWLIKRFVQDGVVTNSFTETVAPQNTKAPRVKEEAKANIKPDVEEHVKEDVKENIEENIKEEEQPCNLFSETVAEKLPSETPAAPEVQYDERICNACLKEFEEPKMVTCTDCDDYDLCVGCLIHDAHGHHPGHAFAPITEQQSILRNLINVRCRPGRSYHHAAICDGCEKGITGVRHKCLACPDWDYCSDCLSTASTTHPGHRFAPIYGAISEPSTYQEVHYGIFCDGPLCKDKAFTSWITGARYKCTVCHDTDFCAKCEALPTNTHNHTHPLVKLKTPVRHVSISTINEDVPMGPVNHLDDRIQKSASTQANAPSQPNVRPVEQTQSTSEVKQPEASVAPVPDRTAEHQALYVCDTVSDGTTMSSNMPFRQTWTLYNPGPLAWPAGSYVRFVGGDTMFNVDSERPSSLQSVAAAMQSNKLSAPLEPGQSADFSVLLRSPSPEGSAISYWRLNLPNGMPFGHRLWCDIRVQAEPEPEYEPVEQEEQEHEKQAEQPAAGEEKPASGESEQRESRMIFPTLDKESPESSTHEAAAAHQPALSAPSTANNTELDYLTITDTMSSDEHEESMDGFLTDEEYDVLDASDQEYLEAKQSQY